MKIIGLASLGVVIGVIAGIMLGSGETRYMNKTESNAVGGPLITICAVLGGACGVVLGIKLIKEERLEKKYGISNVETIHVKISRGWRAETSWFNPITWHQNKIETKLIDRNLVTTFNDQLIYAQTKSAAQKIVTNRHLEARAGIFKSIKTQVLATI